VNHFSPGRIFKHHFSPECSVFAYACNLINDTKLNSQASSVSTISGLIQNISAQTCMILLVFFKFSGK
jgi:hypothetical protein